MEPVEELVGLVFTTKNQSGLYVVTDYDAEKKRLLVSAGITRDGEIHASGNAPWSYDEYSFENAFDMGEWEVRETDRECVGDFCYNSPTDDDYICKWCRYNAAWRERLGA
jgi:hypothetical protein